MKKKIALFLLVGPLITVEEFRQSDFGKLLAFVPPLITASTPQI